MHQYLSDESTEKVNRTQLDVPDDTDRSWTDGDAVAHEHQASESISRGLGRRKRDLRKELRGTEVLEAIMADLVAVAALAAFVLGAIMTVLVVASWAIRHEDKKLTLTGKAPNRLFSGVRRVMGVGQRDVDAELARLITEQLVRR
jgi:hypothetical protein